MEIRLAQIDEFGEIRSFYHSLIDAMEDARYKPGWEKEVYPTDTYLTDSINKKELWIGIENGQLAAAMIVNHEYNEGYGQVVWPTDARPDEITVIHALGVHPVFAGRGLAKKLVEKVFEIAKNAKQKVIRLDVLGGNVPAEKLYVGAGFKYIDTLQMFYEDTGWTDYELYEYKV